MRLKINSTRLVSEILLTIMALVCVLPLVLLLISSITDETTIIQHGYSLFPKKISFYAYQYLRGNALSIFRAYGVTILVTSVGTVSSLAIMAHLAYPLSRSNMPFKKLLTFFIVFTMLFNGGLVPTYMVYTKMLGMKNTLFALLIPNLLVRPFFVLLMKTFFTMSVPPAVIESAKIDGASEWYTFYKIILPLSLPVLATVGLFQIVNYWNDWFNGMIYLTDSRLYSIQNFLNRLLMDIQFLSSSAMSSSIVQGGAVIPTQSVRMALAVIGVLPIILVYPFLQKYFVKGLTVGGVKG